MNYDILNLDFKFTRWRKWYKRDLFDIKIADKEIEYIPDDYDANEDYGLYVGDKENAYKHALVMLQKISGEKADANQMRLVRTCYRRLYKDTENYLKCNITVDEGERKRARFLLEEAAGREISSKIPDMVKQYWEQYRQDTTNSIYDLDFGELYMACGDRALFEKNNIHAAVAFYSLLNLDWGKGEKPKRTRKSVLDYQRIRDKRSLAVFPEGTRELTEECCRFYNRFIKLVSEEGTQFAKIVSCANEFCGAYQTFLNKLKEMELAGQTDGNREYHRLTYLMALRISRESLAGMLYFLADEDISVQEQYKERVLAEIKKTGQESLKPIKRYLLGFRKGGIPYVTVLMLAKAAGSTMMIMDMLLEGDTQQKIAYYTTIDTLRYMLPERTKPEDTGKFSVMHMAYMNDPNEGKILQQYIRDGGRQGGKEHRKSVAYPYVFMKCFTSLVDDLPMWEMYGDHAKGCCVILDKDCLNDEEHGKQIPLYHICYLKKNGDNFELRQEDNPYIKDYAGLLAQMTILKDIYVLAKRYQRALQVYRSILEKIAYFFKNADYQHEQEMRILYSYDEISDEFQHTDGDFPKLYLRPDFEIQMKEIILGPKVENIAEKMPYLQEQIFKMCELTQTDIPELTVSEIEYR